MDRVQYTNGASSPDELRWHSDDARRAALNLMEDAVEARRAAERLNSELHEGERRFREMIDALPTAVYTTDAEGRLTHFNSAAAEFSGRTPEIGTDEWCVSWKLFDADGNPMPHDECPMAISLKTGFPARGVEAIAERPDGTRRWFEPYPSVLRNSAGEIAGGVNMLVDITDRKQAELAMLQTQKLESMGVLAGGIAHDFNNLLTGILGASCLMSDMPGVPDEARPLLDSVSTACMRAADLTRQILAYAGKGRFIVEPLDISALVREITELIRVSVPKNVEITLDLQVGLPAFSGDRGQLQQVVMNLVLNAAESLDGKPGIVFVSTRLSTLDGERQKGGWHSPVASGPGKYVVFRVEDQGVGMDAKTRARIFDPFFSTKSDGRGLGLSAVLGIVRGHQGGLRVCSAPGDGSTLEVLFPVAEADEPTVRGDRDRAPAAEPATRKRSGTILVVDDEDVVRDVVRSALEHFGYTVLTASNGLEGVKAVGAAADKIDRVLLDLVMPVMDGQEALTRIREVRPELPVIVMSGYMEQELNQRFAQDDRVVFLQKPFTMAELARKIDVHR
ncbi:MAG: hybrid sensor histidine kinase/response regulator [Fimbriimonadales bacterium]